MSVFDRLYSSSTTPLSSPRFNKLKIRSEETSIWTRRLSDENLLDQGDGDIIPNGIVPPRGPHSSKSPRTVKSVRDQVLHRSVNVFVPNLMLSGRTIQSTTRIPYSARQISKRHYDEELRRKEPVKTFKREIEQDNQSEKKKAYLQTVTSVDQSWLTDKNVGRHKSSKKVSLMIDLTNKLDPNKPQKAMEPVSKTTVKWEKCGYPNSLSFILEK